MNDQKHMSVNGLTLAPISSRLIAIGPSESFVRFDPCGLEIRDTEG